MTLILHASSVSYEGQALVIIGPSGCGKSGLALQLMAFGATLIADDRVTVTSMGNQLIASCPPSIVGLIEARFVGVLNARAGPPTPVALAVDLGQTEVERVPLHRTVTWLNHEIPLLWGSKSPHLCASLLQMLKSGRSLR
jgi:HPr kinase/phosphorylase